MSCKKIPHAYLEDGVSQELARIRRESIDSLQMELFFSIPAAKEGPIPGELLMKFRYNKQGLPLLIDFREPRTAVEHIRVNGRPVKAEFSPGHLLVRNHLLREGHNEISIRFQAGESSLNRNRDFLYTLFVPDRASTCFPGFDQPDLKARFICTLEVPQDWTAVSNAPVAKTSMEGNRKRITFRETLPIPTYLFSFVAGKFKEETARIGKREMHMFHRETDSLKILRNRDEIFHLHARALDWLESYTGIPYPFDKFDFVLIPSFQYGGMEHPGAILYRDSRLLLDEHPGQQEQLARANLISHETSHMWFGDLVTMRWFDDVWLKEVFAGFMADKIVNPSFPEVDHELLFLLNHYPAAYEVDRSGGANPVGQVLGNLKEAGTLYGNIIYDKAPIVMRQLEMILGEDSLRQGLREYLSAYAYGNASWDDLVAILDRLCPDDLQAWSQAWIKEAGMPEYQVKRVTDTAGSPSWMLVPGDPAKKGRTWPQTLEIMFHFPATDQVFQIETGRPESFRLTSMETADPEYVIPNYLGIGYGTFLMDTASRDYFLGGLQAFDPLRRGVIWINLWENLMNGNLQWDQLLELILKELRKEDDPQLVQRILGYTGSLYWQWLHAAERKSFAPRLENLLWEKTQEATSTDQARTYFMALADLCLSQEAVEKIYQAWETGTGPGKVSLSENDLTSLSMELMLRLPDRYAGIADIQRSRITNPDRLERFDFILPSLSPSEAVRDSCFASFRDPLNREHEPWVLSSLSWLHHPLRHPHSATYILPGLEWLEDIQATGDIFFPKRWLDASLSTYHSVDATATVKGFLEQRPEYPASLRLKILQAADGLFRASENRQKENRDLH